MKRSTLVRARLPDGPAATLLTRRLPTFERLTGLHVELVTEAAADLDLVAIDPRTRHAGSFASLDHLVPPLDLSSYPPEQLQRCRIDGVLQMLPWNDTFAFAFAISKTAPNPEGAALLLRCFCAPSSRTPPPDTLVAHGDH